MKQNKPIKIMNHLIGVHNPPFIVAEMSGNHNQSLERALDIVEAAAKSGAHAVKLQTYTADTMTLDLDEANFCINDSNSLWNGYSLYKLYEEAHTPWEWHEPIFQKIREFGMVPLSSPFDKTAIEFLEKLDCPCYKIASFENTDIPLIREAARTGKPIIVSSGMASIGELSETVNTLREEGCEDIVILKCTSTYPASPDNTNLLTIPHMRQLFDCEIGLSDHTMGIGAAVAATALGATMIEKHFTLDRSDGGIDSAFSMEPSELADLVVETKRAWQSIGEVSYGATQSEEGSLIFRRSLYIVQDIEAEGILTQENLRCIRPGTGLAPKYYDLLLGKKVKNSVKKGTPLSWDLLL